MEQFDRAKRYLKRIENLYEGVVLPTGYDKQAYDDDVLAFFINCYHIRDWVIHLNTCGVTSKEVDQHINKSKELMICADLANGVKHCKITRTLRTKDQPHLCGSEKLTSTYHPDPSIISCKYRVMSNKNILDALELAKSCIASWKVFFEEIKERTQ